MVIKKVLILLPIIIFVVLLQSFFWVPTYDEQVRGNPLRLEEFITASSGDAKILNPVLHADAPSGNIVDQVFNGLIDRDEDLRFRGRLAESWDIYEEAYFYLNQNAKIDGRTLSRPEAVRDMILARRENMNDRNTPLGDTLNNIEAIEIVPPEKGESDIPVPGPDINKDGLPDPVNIKVGFQSPPRLKVTLREVDQDFFKNMEQLLGKGYFDTFPASDYLTILSPGHEDRMSAIAPQVLPAIEHNPVIIFKLRKGV